MLRTRGKQLAGICFFILVFSLTLWGVFHDENLGQVFFYLASANDWWLLPAVICVLFYILGESVIIHYLFSRLGTAVRFSRCALYSFIGCFYSAVTPSASGGQPMQAMAMRKDGIPLAVSTVVLAIVTITYKLVLVVVGLGVVLFRPPVILHYMDVVDPVIYLGIGLNVAFITLLLMMVFLPAATRHLGSAALALWGRIRPLRNPEKARARMDRVIGQYHSTAAFFKEHPVMIANVFLMTLVQRFCLFSVIWFTYKAFGLSGTSPGVMVVLYAMISVAVDMLPLPGGMGISERMFLAIFQPIFGEALILPGMVICRGISYYTQLLISAAMTAAAHFIIRDSVTGTPKT